MTLPRFVGIGALKAGTTAVHDALAGHPGVALPRGRKEVMFFDRHWDRGVGWYADHFHPTSGQAAGEISPGYLYEPAAPARLAATLPDARLFAVLRDPVARAVSQYHHHVREQAYSADFEAFLAEHPNAFERGLYARQLRRWLDHVDGARLLLLRSEDLAADLALGLAPLWPHLGLPPLAAPAAGRTNAAGTARSPALSRLARGAARWLYDRDLGWIVDAARRGGARDLLVRPGAGGRPISPDTLSRLRDRYADDQRDLAAVRALVAGG